MKSQSLDSSFLNTPGATFIVAEVSQPFPSCGWKPHEIQRAATWNLMCCEAGDMSVERCDTIPGTEVFGGRLAMKGYALNKMCFSFNEAVNREAFRRDEDAYCRHFGLNEEQMRAVKNRNVLELLDAGGNVYYLAKWAGIFGMNVQQMGAQQRGMSEEEFRDLLVHSGGR